MSKLKIHLMGRVTLLVFPIPAFAVLFYFENWSFEQFIQFEAFKTIPIAYGMYIGIIYAFLATLIMRAPIFEKVPLKMDELIGAMKLNYLDAIFLSICAGVGEELLFRVGIQFYLGPIITSIVFVAIHGYLNPFNWKMSLYGLVVLPFSFLLGFGYEEFGLWFSIAAHFAYDVVLFSMFISSDNSSTLKNS